MDTIQIIVFVLIPFLAYGLGSISTAVLVSRGLYKQDIREFGSGNAGMTNALRVYGKKAAVLTLVGDLGKAAAAVILSKLLLRYVAGFAPDTTAYLAGACLAAFFVILGHIWPVYFQFRGGKGVLTTLGVWLFIDWRVAAACLVVFGLIVLFSRYVSLGSVIGMVFLVIFSLTAGLLGWYASLWPPLILSASIATMSIIMHRKNIVRLCKGTESKLGHHTKNAAQ